MYEDRTGKKDPKANGPYKQSVLLKTNLQSASWGEEHHVKNDDEIDESHKSQLKFEWGLVIKLHNKNKNLKHKQCFWGF